MRHYLGVRRAGPNTSLVVDVSSGANDGLLSLVARTRSQSGIAARSPLALNFGNEYNFAATKEQDVGEPDAKKFRGGIATSHEWPPSQSLVPRRARRRRRERWTPGKIINK